MAEHWYVYLIMAVVAELLLLVCDKFNIIKSKPLRIFVVILVASLACWGIVDFVIAP